MPLDAVLNMLIIGIRRDRREESSMHKNPYNNEMTYSIKETAIVLGKSYEEVELLIKGKKLGFEMTDHGPAISNRHIVGYFLGEKPYFEPDYLPEKLRKKSRKIYPRARNRR
jgi:hypothetical protein